MAEILSVIEHSSLPIIAERIIAQYALGIHHARLLESWRQIFLPAHLAGATNRFVLHNFAA